MTTAFPADIEPCNSGYSRNLKGGQYSQDFDSNQRYRRKVRRRGVVDTLCFMCNDDQCIRLEQFHRDLGGDFFEVDLPDYTGIATTTARFDSALTIKPVNDFYEISVSLYIPYPAMVPENELDTWLLEEIGITEPGFEVITHTVIHDVLPEITGETL